MGNRKTFVVVCIAMIIFGAVTVSLDMDKRYAQATGFFYIIALILFFIWIVALLAMKMRRALTNQKHASADNLRELKNSSGKRDDKKR